jgi:hypothetical protein
MSFNLILNDGIVEKLIIKTLTKYLTRKNPLKMNFEKIITKVS